MSNIDQPASMDDHGHRPDLAQLRGQSGNQGIIPPQPPMDLTEREIDDQLMRAWVDLRHRWHTVMRSCADIAHPEALPALMEELDRWMRGASGDFRVLKERFQAIGYKGQP